MGKVEVLQKEMQTKNNQLPAHKAGMPLLEMQTTVPILAPE
jgi:hypothetical protein